MVVLRKTLRMAEMWWSTTALPRRPSTRDPGILRYAVDMRPSEEGSSTHRPSDTSVGSAPATPTLSGDGCPSAPRRPVRGEKVRVERVKVRGQSRATLPLPLWMHTQA